MEKSTRKIGQPRPATVSAKHFSVARSDAPVEGRKKTNSGIVIQIRLKNPAPISGKLLTRKNTEFWLSANE